MSLEGMRQALVESSYTNGICLALDLAFMESGSSPNALCSR
jgi:hypothetical protein